jgi:hypothetical protein
MKNISTRSFEDFFEVIHVLEKNLRYVEQLGMEVGTVKAYRKILAYLRGRSEADIEKILGIRPNETTPKPKLAAAIPELTEAEFHDLSPSRVLAFVSDEKLPRSFLEKVATQRFGLTKSGVSSLRTREALLEKMVRMLDHEATHQSIARAVSGSTGESPVATDEVIGVTSRDKRPKYE